MEHKVTHFLYVPFTGLGLYNGHRGTRWLKNRIQIFKQFVVPSIKAQTNQHFIVWVSWRYEDRGDKQVEELYRYLVNQFGPLRVVFTYSGVCFWDDKYPDDVAYDRLINAVHGSLGSLHNVMGEAKEILMTIQPSDDCYTNTMVADVQNFFSQNKDTQVVGYKKGYVMDYTTLKMAEWNPKTTPPFYTIRFPRETFIDPYLHVKYTGPYKSHEYVKDHLPAQYEEEERGFIVGTHGANISTVFDHPYTGPVVDYRIARSFFGLGVEPLKMNWSLRSWIFHRFPYGVKRKLRYWSEKNFLAAWFYNFIRG